MSLVLICVKFMHHIFCELLEDPPLHGYRLVSGNADVAPSSSRIKGCLVCAPLGVLHRAGSRMLLLEARAGVMCKSSVILSTPEERRAGLWAWKRRSLGCCLLGCQPASSPTLCSQHSTGQARRGEAVVAPLPLTVGAAVAQPLRASGVPSTHTPP